jgi:hypothetical protein
MSSIVSVVNSILSNFVSPSDEIKKLDKTFADLEKFTKLSHTLSLDEIAGNDKKLVSVMQEAAIRYLTGMEFHLDKHTLTKKERETKKDYFLYLKSVVDMKEQEKISEYVDDVMDHVTEYIETSKFLFGRLKTKKEILKCKYTMLLLSLDKNTSMIKHIPESVVKLVKEILSKHVVENDLEDTLMSVNEWL